MKLNLNEVPLSYRGSYFAFSIIDDRLILKDLHGGDELSPILFILKIDAIEKISDSHFKKNYQLIVNEVELKIKSKTNSEHFFRVSFTKDNELYFEGNGLSVEFNAEKIRYDTFYQLAESQYEFISYKKDQRFRIKEYLGRLAIDAPWLSVGNQFVKFSTSDSMAFAFSINYYKVAYEDTDIKPDFSQLVTDNARQLNNFRQAFFSGSSKEFNLATYLLWSNQVSAQGQLLYPCVYMSKNWMQNIWSWDNCFSALALAKADPEMAFNQFKVFFEHQSLEGAYPDFINDKVISFSCVKPPIHAWAYDELLKENKFFSGERLKIAYQSIAKNIDFWFNYRRHTSTQLFYYSHGNDSGWDNASIFSEGMPVSSPDLIAYLAQSCSILEKWAIELELDERPKWQKRFEELKACLLSRYYNSVKHQFVSLNARTGEQIAAYDSLILRMPLVIGNLLPKEISQSILKDLHENFETDFGFATEALTSSQYKSEGYWLGPIWAPVTYLLIKAIVRMDEGEVAKTIGKKFIHLTKIGGMAENYDALTGKGNDDLGFAWSSAVYLLLAEEYGE